MLQQESKDYVIATGMQYSVREFIAKAKADLGWVPQITLDEMIAEMVANDLAHAQRQALLQRHGYKISVSME